MYLIVILVFLNLFYDIIGVKNFLSKLDVMRNGFIFLLVKKVYIIMNFLVCDYEFDLNMGCIDILLNELELGIFYYC